MNDAEQDDVQKALELLRAEFLEEIELAARHVEMSAKQRQRFLGLLQRLDMLDRRYRDKVAQLEDEVSRLKRRVAELEGGVA